MVTWPWLQGQGQRLLLGLLRPRQVLLGLLRLDQVLLQTLLQSPPRVVQALQQVLLPQVLLQALPVGVVLPCGHQTDLLVLLLSSSPAVWRPRLLPGFQDGPRAPAPPASTHHRHQSDTVAVACREGRTCRHTC
jgi:hypothetical protein